MATAEPLLAQSRTDGARAAFGTGDADLSKRVHDSDQAKKLSGEHPEPTLSEGRLVKPLVFGGLDGVSTVFAVLAGGVGASVSVGELLAMGCANALAGAFSMAVGEYLSSVGERDVAQREMDRERWEVRNYPEGEVAEMTTLYVEKGLSKEDAAAVAQILSKYEDFWVEHMLLTEIGMLPPDDDSPLNGAAVMFFAFLGFGSLPLVIFAAVTTSEAEFGKEEAELRTYAFMMSALFTVLSLFVLGALKAKLADQSIWKGGSSMAIQGTIAGALAFTAGNYFS